MAFLGTCLFRLQVAKRYLPNSQANIVVNFVRHRRGSLKRIVPRTFLSEDEAQQQIDYDSSFKNLTPVEEEKRRSTTSFDQLISEDLKLGRTKLTSLVRPSLKQPIFHAKDTVNAPDERKYPDVPQYEKLAEDDERFKAIMMTLSNRKEREKKNKILLEGRDLIKDAIEAGVKVETIYFSYEDLLTGLGLDRIKGLQIFRLLYRHLQVWSTGDTCLGVIAVCKRPTITNLTMNSSKRIPVTVICDNVRGPDNLGAILRCVAAAGCEKVIAATGCVDVWNPKVIRGGHGAHFRLPIYNNVDWTFIKNYLPDNYRVIIADNNILEGRINLPSLRTENYINVDFTKGEHLVLIIGGETDGISAGTCKLAHDSDGIKTFIPLANNVESLNVASAIAVLTFEMCRQFSASTSK